MSYCSLSYYYGKTRSPFCVSLSHFFRCCNRLKIGQAELCTCCTGKMTGEQILQECPTYEAQRKHMWPTPMSAQEKLYGGVHQLQPTNKYFRSIQVEIWKWSKKMYDSRCISEFTLGSHMHQTVGIILRSIAANLEIRKGSNSRKDPFKRVFTHIHSETVTQLSRELYSCFAFYSRVSCIDLTFTPCVLYFVAIPSSISSALDCLFSLKLSWTLHE